jgi:hypothetical protein
VPYIPTLSLFFPDVLVRHQAYAYIDPQSDAGNPLSKGCAMSQPCANCRITIRGSFTMDWAEYLGDMLAYVQVEEGTIRSTTLISRPIDLAAFLGTLNMLSDRGFPVMAFEYRQADPLEAAPDGSPPNSFQEA